jgi:N-acetylglucosamine-6-phosphate deacetylase
MISSIDNSNVFIKGSVENNQDLFISDGKIRAINYSNTVNTNSDITIPGFIDLQIYGAANRLFSAEPSLESLEIIENDLLSKGTTSFLICLATNTPEVFKNCIEVVKTYRNQARNCMGLHLEGPFLNIKKSGAHVKEYIRKATLDEIKELIDFGDGTIKMMTIAPETQDEKVIEYLLDNNVIVSLGHSDATYEQATQAYNKGIQSTTHLFNAMSSLLHRAPGIPSAVFNHKKAMTSIIADGFHVDFEVVKIAQKLLKERLFLITDAVTECSIGPYQHKEIEGKFVMPDGTLSGSALTMLQAVKNCVAYCDIDLNTAIKMATEYPAKLMGLENLIGTIKVGADANFVILDKELNIKEVYFRGNKI